MYNQVSFFRPRLELIVPTNIAISILYENLKSVINYNSRDPVILRASLLIKHETVRHNGNQKIAKYVLKIRYNDLAANRNILLYDELVMGLYEAEKENI